MQEINYYELGYNSKGRKYKSGKTYKTKLFNLGLKHRRLGRKMLTSKRMIEDILKLEETLWGISEFVNSYPNKDWRGFSKEEIEDVIKRYPSLNLDKFNNALVGITCVSDKQGNTIIYHTDIITALRCGLENREIYSFEWD